VNIPYIVRTCKKGLALSARFTRKGRFDSLRYHESELKIQLDPQNPARVVPVILPHHRRILDIGCGMGQTLVALNLREDIETFGVDCDRRAIQAGKGIVPKNISLLCAAAENLPFPDEYFDFIFSRVTLPYTNLQRVLREISRTLKPGGDTWLALQSFSILRRRFLQALMHMNIREIASCSYVLLNGLLLALFGLQLSLLGRNETYQTISGMTSALNRVGLTCTSIETGKFFIMNAAKPVKFKFRRIGLADGEMTDIGRRTRTSASSLLQVFRARPESAQRSR
jgi:SAM-dependent methyltransferase